MFIDYLGRVYVTHSPMRCADDRRCVIHRPSVHGMTWWAAIMREDRGYLVERICRHGIGHPDPDSLAYFFAKGDDTAGIHGCDGCCTRALAAFDT